MTTFIESLLVGSDHVVINGGIVDQYFVRSHRGFERFVVDPPAMTYFVTLHEAEGGEIGLWDGPSLAKAREAARQASADWDDCAIVDWVPA